MEHSLEEDPTAAPVGADALLAEVVHLLPVEVEGVVGALEVLARVEHDLALVLLDVAVELAAEVPGLSRQQVRRSHAARLRAPLGR